MLTVYDLRCEHERQPLAMDSPRPRFSWKLQCGEGNVVQAERRLQVGRDPELSSLVWDSGPVASRESHLVEYGGAPLEQCARYYYRVRVRDSRGGESGWSDPSWFETALAPASWKARFIGLEVGDEATTSRPVYFRREFSLDSEASTARIYATALGVYELWINGVRVGDAYFAPGWTNYRKRLAYQSYDVTGLLRPGRNAIGAIVGPGWYKGDLTWLNARNLYGQKVALSLALAANGPDGEPVEIVSDASWRAGRGPITYSEIYHGESYDARLDREGWSSAGFDDGDWSPVALRELDLGRLVPQDGPPVCKQERLPAQRLLTTPRGEAVLDFGQNLTGWVEFTVSGKAGERVVLRHAEVLDAEGNFYTDNLRSARARIEYTLKGGGPETYEPHFTFHGFRFVRVEEYPGPIDPRSFTAVVLHSRMEPSLSFACSNPLLNQLHHNILWGWKGNALDIPTDCPQRDERLGWTGDAQVFIGTATYLTHAAPFYRKWLRDLASEQREDGGVPYVVPDVLPATAPEDANIRSTHSSTGWGDAAVICPWTIYARYGDLELLREHYPHMRAWVEYIRARAQGGLLWNTGFHFGDWVALDAKEGSYFGATPNDLTATAYYAHSAGLLAHAAEALGNAEEASRYRALRTSIVAAFQDEFITPSGRLAARTQTAHVLALAFDLVPARHRARTIRDLAALLEENGNHLTTGFLGTPVLCRALADGGRLDLAYTLLLREDFPSWLYQVKQGATTVWEHWDGIKPDGTMWSPNMNSFNHYAYGAVGEWIYATVGGIAPDPDSPGFRSFLLAPRPGGGITHAKTTYESPYGTIGLEWKIEGDRFELDAEVPPNSTARIVLDGVAAESVTGSAQAAFRDEGGAAISTLGSGRYRLACRRPPLLPPVK